MAAPTIEECKQGFADIAGRRVPFRHPSGSFGTRATIPFNVTGLPALSVCCGFTDGGLPLGLQVVGACFDEGRVFQVAHAYEQAAGWVGRKPGELGQRCFVDTRHEHLSTNLETCQELLALG